MFSAGTLNVSINDMINLLMSTINILSSIYCEEVRKWGQINLVYLVHLVSLVYLVDLVFLVYLVSSMKSGGQVFSLFGITNQKIAFFVS